MANWCSNTLVFTGGDFLPFKQEIIDSIGSNEGLRIFDDSSMCIFDGQGTVEDDYIYFESRWTPPIQDLVKRAKRDSFTFNLEYYECGCQIFGKAIFDENGLCDISLPSSVFDKITYDEDGEAYVNGEYLESVEEWLEDQLDLIS